MAEQDRKCASSSMNSRFYPDLLRSSSTSGIPLDINSGSSSVDSDSTLVAVQDNDDVMASNVPINNGWLNEMTPFWQNMYSYNNHYDHYIPNTSLQCSNTQFQHHNYNYSGFDMTYKNSGNLFTPPPRHKRQQWVNGNEVNSEGRAVALQQNNHSQTNNHGHYHPLQTVGILFNGPANEPQRGDDVLLIRNPNVGQCQALSKHTELPTRQGVGLSYSQQHPFNMNSYANTTWKQHVDDGALATLPRRPYSAQSFRPYNTEFDLSSNYNQHYMARSKTNLSQSSSSASGIPGLLSQIF